MKVVLFCHSLLSDWNHGNAHFLRGVVTDLQGRGHTVDVYEPADAWSVQNLLRDGGRIDDVRDVYPGLTLHRYTLPGEGGTADAAAQPSTSPLDLDRALDGADLVVVHEWSDHRLVQQIGEARRDGGRFRLLFHDTHHRAVSAPEQMAAYDLRHYDGVLAFGEVIRRLYLERGWTARAWTFHEAADPRVFHPLPELTPVRDLVWIGNWGDDERTSELHEFLITPVKQLALSARVHGVRYPQAATAALSDAGIEYAGWLPNYRVPRAFAEARLTVHVPRRPYVEALQGIPTIRPFEALACGIPLVTAPWDDVENLFTPGRDYWVVKSGAEMQRALKTLLSDPAARAELASHGRQTVLSRHTCAHRVDHLLNICRELGLTATAPSEERACA